MTLDVLPSPCMLRMTTNSSRAAFIASGRKQHLSGANSQKENACKAEKNLLA